MGLSDSMEHVTTSDLAIEHSNSVDEILIINSAEA